MSVKKQIILIPYWVQESVNRNKMQLHECLEFEKLKPIMSLNDLVCFSTLQHYVEKCTGLKDFSIGSLFMTWIKSIPNGSKETIDYLTKNVCGLEADPSFRKEVETRLFIAEAKEDRYDVPFITYDLTPEVAGVVIYPGFFVDSSNHALQFNLIEALLKVLYVYDSYNEVSKTPLFKRYLELLSKKQVIV